MKKKFFTAVLVALASVALIASPAVALDDPGVLVTVNPAGGTGLADGLKIDLAYGQLQIQRNGRGQLYDDTGTPDPTNRDRMANYFVVAIKDGQDNITNYGDGSNLENSWDSFTSESTLADSGRSGTLINHMFYGAGSSQIQLDVTLTYVYPNQFFNVSASVTLGSDYAGFQHKIYWYTDSSLEGSDNGHQFGGTTPSGQTVAGVVSEGGTHIEAFRQVAGQNFNWYAGFYECPYLAENATNCGVETTDGFVPDFADFPNVYATDSDAIDNGFGVSSPVSTAATEMVSFDLVFTTCVDQSPLPCVDHATGNDPVLSDTGIDVVAVITYVAGSAALAVTGLILVLLRRRQQAKSH